jgi:peptidoglycan/xylan/chitin deacetylase (PgdA/CDA1 family)
MNYKRPAAVSVAVLLFLLVIGASLRTGEPLLEVTQVAGDPPLARDVTPTDSVSPTLTLTPLPTETSTSTPSPTPTATQTPSPTATRTRVPTTATPPPRVARVPILMYHYVSVLPPDADKVRMDLTVSPDAFQTQMDYLTTNGYHPIRLSDLADYLLDGAPLPDKPIVLTFDDGYADNYANVFPTLRIRKFPATFFIITEFVNESRWGYLSWAQLAEMVKGGMEIGSHSLDHPSLYRKSRSFQDSEIAGSKRMIEANLPVTVVSFSYPSGDYDANTLAALRAAGYLGAVTEIQGARQSSDKILELRRIRIRGSYSINDFVRWLKYYEENGK